MKSYADYLKEINNLIFTENGALAHRSTKSKLLDLFAMGGAYRNRSDEDCINLFNDAYEEDALNAIKCLFYLRDCRGGQGERRFFRVCYNWLSNAHPEVAKCVLPLIPEYGRWDDLYYCTWNTPIFNDALEIIKNQLILDMECNTPSLLAKWVKSENTSSFISKMMGAETRKYLGISHKHYRKMLSKLRSKINVLEKLMSENRWDEIKFDKLPSKAGFIYKNAFAHKDVLKERYREFAKSKKTTVNAKTLYPYECVKEALKLYHYSPYYSTDAPQRAMVNKYWENLTNYFDSCNFNALCVIDTSGSMTVGQFVKPIDVAISLGLYCAERAHGPFYNHYISFSSRPQLIETSGYDFVNKVHNIYKKSIVDDTNIEKVFDLLLTVAIDNKVDQEDLPENIIIISDMEFNAATSTFNSRNAIDKYNVETLLEEISWKWERAGYKMPHLIFWNVNAMQNNIPAIGEGRISYVSGFSPSIFKIIMSGKKGYELMIEALSAQRYNAIEEALTTLSD